MPLSKEDLHELAVALAPMLNQHMSESYQIPPERHYQDHMAWEQLCKVFDAETISALREMLASYRTGKSIFWRVFLTVAALGSMALAFQGWISGKFHGG